MQVGWLWPLLEPPAPAGRRHGLHSTTSWPQLGRHGGRLDRVLQVADTVTRHDADDPGRRPRTHRRAGGDEHRLLRCSRARQARSPAPAGRPRRPGWPRCAPWCIAPGVELDLTAAGRPRRRRPHRQRPDLAASCRPASSRPVPAALGRRRPHRPRLAARRVAWTRTRWAPWPAGAPGRWCSTRPRLPQRAGGRPPARRPVAAVAPPAGRSPPPSPRPASSATCSRSSRVDGPGRQLPELVAEVAIRAVEAESAIGRKPATAVRGDHPAALRRPAPRWPAEAILATADTTWSKPLTLRRRHPKVTPVAAGRRSRPRRGSPQAPAADGDREHPAAAELGTGPGQHAAGQPRPTDQLGWIPGAVPEPAVLGLERRTRRPGWPVRQLALQRLDRRCEKGVYIVPPSSGTYTLGSSNSPLPLTAAEHPALSGHRRGRRLTRRLGAGRLHRRRVHDRRSGRTRRCRCGCRPTSSAPAASPCWPASTPRCPRTSGLLLGRPVHLTVHSTALGTIGIDHHRRRRGGAGPGPDRAADPPRCAAAGPRPPAPAELAAIPQ